MRHTDVLPCDAGRSTLHCCNDGHSTYFWARGGFEVYSVDIDGECRKQIDASYAALGEALPSNLHMEIPRDGLEFLAQFQGSIDLLSLDGWDLGLEGSTERHRDAFLAARDKLAPVHFIAVDDTDFQRADGGKDALLTPLLAREGNLPLMRGRQTVFVKL